MLQNPPNEYWMQRALTLAKQAEASGEVPVGAVIVLNNEIIGKGYNQPIASHDPSAHAEIIALRDAGKNIGNYRLNQATMYVTLEPCAMCAGAILHARLQSLYFAATDPKTGAICSLMNLLDDYKHNHQLLWEQGILAQEARELLQRFFKIKRNSISLSKKNERVR